MARKRRQLLKYGPSYETLINKREFRTGQMRKIEKKCREEIEIHCEELINKFKVFGHGPSGKANIIPFEMFDFGFLLEYDDEEKIWVLHVTKESAKKKSPLIGKSPARRGVAGPDDSNAALRAHIRDATAGKLRSGQYSGRRMIGVSQVVPAATFGPICTSRRTKPACV